MDLLIRVLVGVLMLTGMGMAVSVTTTAINIAGIILCIVVYFVGTWLEDHNIVHF